MHISSVTIVAATEQAAPWWVLPIVGAAFLILLVSYVRRGSKAKLKVEKPRDSWKDRSRSGYADARWLYDTMTEDLALWRGRTVFDPASEANGSPSTAHRSAWDEMDRRVGQASDHLYAAEAGAPDPRAGAAASGTVTAMRSVRRAIDARADARVRYRTVEHDPDATQSILQEAREGEVRAARNLAEARSRFGSALGEMSKIL